MVHCLVLCSCRLTDSCTCRVRESIESGVDGKKSRKIQCQEPSPLWLNMILGDEQKPKLVVLCFCFSFIYLLNYVFIMKTAATCLAVYVAGAMDCI